MLNETCCFWVNTFSQFKEHLTVLKKNIQTLQDLKEQVGAFSGWLQSLFGGSFSLRWGIWSWLMPLLIPVIIILMLFMIAPCIINCLTCSASAQFQQITTCSASSKRIFKTTPNHGKYHSPLGGYHYKGFEA